MADTGLHFAQMFNVVKAGNINAWFYFRNLLMHFAEKILLMQPLTFGGITEGPTISKPRRNSRLTGSQSDHSCQPYCAKHDDITDSYAPFPDIAASNPAAMPPQTPPDIPELHVVRLPKELQ